MKLNFITAFTTANDDKEWCHVKPGCPGATTGDGGDWSEQPCDQDVTIA